MSRLFNPGDVVRYDEPGTGLYCFARLTRNPVSPSGEDDVWHARIIGHGTLYAESPYGPVELPEAFLTGLGRPYGALLFTVGTLLAVLVTAVIGVWLIAGRNVLAGVTMLVCTAAGLAVLIVQQTRQQGRYRTRSEHAA